MKYQTAPEPDGFKRQTVLKLSAMLMLAGLLSVTGPNLTASQAKSLSGAEVHVTKIAGSVISLANSGSRGTALHRKFERLLATHANMGAVAMFSLGRYRRKLPASMRSRYQKLVKAYIAGLFVYYAGDFKGRRLEIRGSRKSGKSLIIDSRIKFGGSSKKVMWRVYSKGNRHRVTDVNMRGVWLSIQMRQKFTGLLKRNKGDFNALLSFLGEYKNWMPKG